MLEQLDAKFVRWRNGELAGEELHEAIHEYHQNESRQLWSVYRNLKRDQIVARGVGMGSIPAEQLSGTLQAKLANTIGWYKHLLERENEPPEHGDDEDDEE